MLKQLKLENILFLDIETVPQQQHHEDLDESTRILWEAKTRYRRKDEISAEDFYKEAGIWAEFGKIICISAGFFHYHKGKRSFRVRSFSGPEVQILTEFKNLLETYFNQEKHLLCAHNGKEFDFPYIARRMIIHQINLPKKLDLFGKKPWEVPHLDTMELWKFGDYKSFTSLNLMTHILQIPSPKDDIDGSEVYRVYFEEQDIDRIVRYCEKDTVAVAQIFLRLRNEPILEEEEIVQVQ